MSFCCHSDMPVPSLLPRTFQKVLAPTQCAYLFLSMHCKCEASCHRMPGQPPDQWETRSGNTIGLQVVIGWLLGQTWLLSTDYTSHTLFKTLFTFRGILAVVSTLHFEGVFLSFGPTPFTFWPTCRFARRRMITSKFKIRFIGGEGGEVLPPSGALFILGLKHPVVWDGDYIGGN